jgi:outer membrane lipoprotein carrier protein
MMKRAILLALTILALPARESDPLLARLQEKLDHLKALRGRFIQTLDSASLGRSRTEEGTLAFKKPARMRWDYLKPEPKVAVADGRRTWLYLPEDRQVLLGTLRNLEEEGAAALLLAGRISLLKDFGSRRLAASETGPIGVAGGVAIELTPLGRAGEYRKITLVIDPERLQIRRLEVIDEAGERMIFELFDLEENPDLSEKLFRLEIPEGVEIVDER